MNPFEMQKKMYEEWEKNLGKYLESTMRQPEFMKLVGRNLEATLDLQGAVKGHLQKALKTLAIPTEAELEGLYRTVNQLETKVLDLEEALEDLRDRAAVKPAPKAQAKPAAEAAPEVPAEPASKVSAKPAAKPAARPAAKTPAKSAARTRTTRSRKATR